MVLSFFISRKFFRIINLCLAIDLIQNKVGTYSCDCPTGYISKNQGRTCQDNRLGACFREENVKLSYIEIQGNIKFSMQILRCLCYFSFDIYTIALHDLHDQSLYFATMNLKIEPKYFWNICSFQITEIYLGNTEFILYSS